MPSNDVLQEQIKQQGDLVRKLKAAKEPKEKVIVLINLVIGVREWEEKIVTF